MLAASPAADWAIMARGLIVVTTKGTGRGKIGDALDEPGDDPEAPPAPRLAEFRVITSDITSKVLYCIFFNIDQSCPKGSKSNGLAIRSAKEYLAVY